MNKQEREGKRIYLQMKPIERVAGQTDWLKKQATKEATRVTGPDRGDRLNKRREAIEYERFPIETREEIGKGGRSNGSLN